MALERLAPDALLEQTNLSGAVTDIDDDPDAPDAAWLTAASNNADSIARTSFPSPSGALAEGAGLQEFRVLVRKMGGTGTPSCRIELYESGALISTPLGDTSVTSTSGVVLAGTWDATGRTAANIECRVYGTKSGGSPSVRAAIEVGAVEWNADVAAAAPPSGTGSIAGGGSLAGIGMALLAATGLIVGGGALAGVGQATHGGTGSLSGGGTLAGISAAGHAGTGSLSGGGALAGIGEAPTGAASGTGTLSGGGVLSGVGVAIHVGTGNVTGGGTLAGIGEAPSAVPEGVGTLSGDGTLSGIGVTVRSGTGSLSGGGTLSGQAGGGSLTTIGWLVTFSLNGTTRAGLVISKPSLTVDRVAYQFRPITGDRILWEHEADTTSTTPVMGCL